MARTDYGAILSTKIADTSQAIRDVEQTVGLISPAEWGSRIRAMHSQSDYDNVMAQLVEETASGDIVSFADGANDIPVKSLIANVDPVQALHGYDHPWAGGAGKNKLNCTATTQTINGITFTVNDDGTILVNGTAIADARLNLGIYIAKAHSSQKLNGLPSSVTTDDIVLGYQGYGVVNLTTRECAINRNADTDWNNDVYITVKAGATANNLTFKPMIRLSTEPDDTFEPYENICQITGRTSATVTHLGKNLYDKSTITTGKYITNTGTEYTSQKGTYSDFIAIKTGVPYYFSHIIGSNSFYSVAIYDNEKTFIKIKNISGNKDASNTLTFDEGAYIRVNVNLDFIDVCQIELGSTATAYEPYVSPTTYTKTFPLCYGGKLNLTTGALEVTHAIVDLGTLNWSAAGNMWFSPLSGVKPISDTTVPNAICTQYKAVSWVSGTSGTEEGVFCFLPAYNQLRVRDTSYSSASDFKTAMNGVQLVYELADPLVAVLTKEEIKTFLGGNTFYADTGDVEVVYYANGQLYVAQH